MMRKSTSISCEAQLRLLPTGNAYQEDMVGSGTVWENFTGVSRRKQKGLRRGDTRKSALLGVDGGLSLDHSRKVNSIKLWHGDCFEPAVFKISRGERLIARASP